MTAYNDLVRRQVRVWKIRMLKDEPAYKKMVKGLQIEINNKIPQRAHDIITRTVKGIIHSTLFGLRFVPSDPPKPGLSLEERDTQAQEMITKYRKIASIEGAGTGAGGLLLGLSDFPALIAIKMQLLFKLAHIYGYNTLKRNERLFLLYIFQLTFTTPNQRKRLFPIIENWNEYKFTGIDWEQFQKDYRDSMDIRKMLQLIPGVGAAVGAWANYGLLNDLSQSAVNCFRIRYFKENK